MLLKDRLPAHISWSQFEANVRRIADNAARGKGTIRHGPSLLSGLVVCGRCGLRMLVRYANNGQELRYACAIMAVNYGRAPCQSLLGRIVDDWVGQQVLAALQPAALEVSLRAIENVQAERAQLHRHWQLRLERACYEEQRAQYQFNAVEPENRLVARTLERQWEAALAAQAQLQGEYARFEAEQPAVLDEAEREAIRQLAADVPALWHAPTTTVVDRQAIVRQLVERVVVRIHGQSERFDVQLHWVGGYITEATLVRPVARLEQLSYYPQLLARAAALHAQGEKLTTVAEHLNAEGWHPAKRRATFNASMVHVLLAAQGLCSRGRRYSDAVEQRTADEWTLSQLAHRLTIPEPTLYRWLRRGELRGRRVVAAAHPLWLVQADEAELARLRTLREQPRTWRH